MNLVVRMNYDILFINNSLINLEVYYMITKIKKQVGDLVDDIDNNL